MIEEQDQLPQHSDLNLACETVDVPEIDKQASNFEDILVSFEQSQRVAHVGALCAQIIDCLTECINRVREISQETANEVESNQINLEPFHQSCTRGGNFPEDDGRQFTYIHVKSMVLTNQYLYEELHRSIVRAINQNVHEEDTSRCLVMDAVDQIVRGNIHDNQIRRSG